MQRLWPITCLPEIVNTNFVCVFVTERMHKRMHVFWGMEEGKEFLLQVRVLLLFVLKIKYKMLLLEQCCSALWPLSKTRFKYLLRKRKRSYLTFYSIRCIICYKLYRKRIK
ncbi:hypothetical protein KIL84_018361 [Mauremys mutica]|uniref:Uncharacterized protein n=1 Tax=Mauremys mutica TaxID=74926 RepID=A0A9D3XTI0_9SAUR|nr:hypothetical protein KIL84_018361 [Mauremys mutica]